MSRLGLRRLIAAIRLATLELRARALQRAIERHYRADQPRAPRGTPIGGQWIDDHIHVAAKRPSPRCDGFSAGCQNGGSFGSSGAIRIQGKKLCWDCALKYLGIQDMDSEEQLKTIGDFDPKAWQ